MTMTAYTMYRVQVSQVASPAPRAFNVVGATLDAALQKYQADNPTDTILSGSPVTSVLF